MLIPRRQTADPFAMKLVALDGEGGKLRVGDLDALRAGVFVNARLDAKALAGRGAADQIDDHLPTAQRTSSPVGRDRAEHPVALFVPLAGAGREMAHLNRHPQLVRKLLQL